MAHGAGQPGPPWDSVERARQLAQPGHLDEIVKIRQ
jgi:hypothetical protein